MTVSCICDDKAEAGPEERKRRYRENNIVYDEAGSFQRDLFLTQFYGKDIGKRNTDSLVIVS